VRLPRLAVRKPTPEALRREGIPPEALRQPTELQRLLRELKRECVAAGVPPGRL
jgi:hypothetical protein